MAKTSSQAVDILCSIISNTLTTDPERPTGKIYKFQRPVNSVLEDVVINSLSINREDVQRGLLNVNIYVPNLVIPKATVTDHTQPNLERLSYLSALINNAFSDDIWDDNGDYCFSMQQDNLFQDENNQHYVNFRIEFYSANI